jgi:hypothetical protein
MEAKMNKENFSEKFWNRFLSNIPTVEFNNNKCIEWQPAYVDVFSESISYPVMQYSGKKDSVHRLSFLFFNGEIPDGMFVLHSCNNRRCVNPLHLRTGTHNQNMVDMTESGRSLSGEQHLQSKLTEDIVKELREKRKNGYRLTDLSKEYNITHSNVSAICLGKTWKHIGGPIVLSKEIRAKHKKFGRRVHSNEKITQARNLFKETGNITDVCNLLSCSKDVAYAIVKGKHYSEYGGPTVKSVNKAKKWHLNNEINKLRSNGLKLSDIAKELNFSESHMSIVSREKIEYPFND